MGPAENAGVETYSTRNEQTADDHAWWYRRVSGGYTVNGSVSASLTDIRAMSWWRVYADARTAFIGAKHMQLRMTAATRLIPIRAQSAIWCTLIVAHLIFWRMGIYLYEICTYVIFTT